MAWEWSIVLVGIVTSLGAFVYLRRTVEDGPAASPAQRHRWSRFIGTHGG